MENGDTVIKRFKVKEKRKKEEENVSVIPGKY